MSGGEQQPKKPVESTTLRAAAPPPGTIEIEVTPSAPAPPAEPLPADGADTTPEPAKTSEVAKTPEAAKVTESTVEWGATPRHRRPGIPVRQWPVRSARAAGRWSRRPAGRLVLPGLLLAALVGLTGTAGAYLIPSTAPAPVRQAAPQVSEEPTGIPDPGLPTGIPGQPLPPLNPPMVPVGGRGAAALAGWATPLTTRLQVPQTALEAYGYAQLVLEQTQPACKLSWTTLAAIGKVESDHGRARGATLTGDGRSFPPIVGDPLDGQGGRRLIRDSDSGQLDSDAVYDRAVGPMQFIPTTWRTWQVDADNSGGADPHDIDDATLAAGNYLCSGGRDMSSPTGWIAGILSYNNVQAYAQAVFTRANEYGTGSRS